MMENKINIDQLMIVDHLRAELAEADQDYNSISDSEQNNPSTSSGSEDDATLQSVTKLPHLSPEKSPLDACEAAKLEQFCSETCHCKLGPNRPSFRN